jgi:hypothetical protein
MRTEILEAEVVGTRTGIRDRITTYTRTRRYDYYDGNDRYMYSGNETTGSIFKNPTAVELAVVAVGEDKVSFDMGWMLMPRPVSSVHVLVHHIGGAKVMDLYEDRSGLITAEGDFPYAEPTRRWGIATAVVVTLVLIWLGHDQWWSLKWGAGCGLGLYLLNQAHHHYVARGLAILRWRAAQRLRKSAGAKGK